MSHFEFANPWFLLLLTIIPLMVIGRMAFKNKVRTTLGMPSLKGFAKGNTWHRYIDSILYFLRLSALALLIIGLARPRKVDVSTSIKSDEGVDIMMVVDVSLSMLAKDLKPNRIAALQSVAKDFIQKRISDRIGLVVYSGEALTQVPLTTDKNVLLKSIDNLRMDELEPGTAIGLGLATAVNHLEHSKAKSKVVLLITDGVESPAEFGANRVYISPEDAALIAAEKGIKVYTIGIGTTGFIPLPQGYEHYPQKLFRLDENILKYIANETNGLYFRATDNDKLESIYNEINQLEKSKINEIKYYDYDEYYRVFVLWAFVLLLTDVVCRTLFFKQLT